MLAQGRLLSVFRAATSVVSIVIRILQILLPAIMRTQKVAGFLRKYPIL